MLLRLRLLLALLCVTLLTTMVLAAPEPVDFAGCASPACVQAADMAVDPESDEALHLCFHACHATMLLPTGFAFQSEPLRAGPVMASVLLPRGKTTGPLLLPPIA